MRKTVTKFNQRQFSKCYKWWDIWSLFEPVQILKLKDKLYTVHWRMPNEPWIHRNSFLHNLFMWWHSRTNSDVVRKKCNRSVQPRAFTQKAHEMLSFKTSCVRMSTCSITSWQWFITYNAHSKLVQELLKSEREGCSLSATYSHDVNPCNCSLSQN